MKVEKPCHAVAIFGGACAGSVAAEVLAEAGHRVVVFEQNVRPYGKIEDGLPRWHKEQRRMEYGKIDQRLDRPGVTFVPRTKLGRDVEFEEIVEQGWSAVLLANGAWIDRPLDAAGASDVVERGLVYQNSFIYWFNHMHETGFDGPRYEIPPGPVCVGGGLASIDVVKVMQLELYARALRQRGVSVDLIAMEHEGIPKYCQTHGVEDPASLGVEDALLIYRRRVEDMPLASPPPGANAKQLEKIAQVREKILSKCQRQFLFKFRPMTVTEAVVVEDGRLRGLKVQGTRLDERGNAVPVPGSEEVIRTDLVVSSIGSVPEAIPGIERKGAYYRYKDWDTGEYEPLPGVYGLGNVVTGKGNIKASLEHGKAVAEHLIANYLGVGEPGERDISAGFTKAAEQARAQTGAVQEHLARVAPLPPAKVEALLELARARQRQVGYDCSYRDWIARVSPPDME